MIEEMIWISRSEFHSLMSRLCRSTCDICVEETGCCAYNCEMHKIEAILSQHIIRHSPDVGDLEELGDSPKVDDSTKLNDSAEREDGLPF